MRIKINGKEKITELRDLYSIKAGYFPGNPENLVVILNGFQTPDNLQINDGDEIVLIEKGEMPEQTEFEAMLSARHTPGVYERVKKARVAVAGLGGLGSNIAVALARTGVGHLHLVDFDVVEPSNLNRQQYRIKHLGMYKTEAMQLELAEINPFISVSIDTVRVTEKNAVALFAADEIVCEAFDHPEAKALLINSLLTRCPAPKIVGGSGMAGFESSNTIQTQRVMKNFYLCGDRQTQAQVGRGLMAPRVGVCAGHQANMVLRLLLGQEDA
jgi:sulfur carrier protein ThiS adenylyltransferase